MAGGHGGAGQGYGDGFIRSDLHAFYGADRPPTENSASPSSFLPAPSSSWTTTAAAAAAVASSSYSTSRDTFAASLPVKGAMCTMIYSLETAGRLMAGNEFDEVEVESSQAAFGCSGSI